MNQQSSNSDHPKVVKGLTACTAHDINSDTQINRESITFIWLDLESQSTSTFIGALRAINDCVRTYNNVSTCLKELKASKHKNFLISTSNSDDLIATLHSMDNVEAIFVLNSDRNVIKDDYSKYFGVFRQQEELIRVLKETVDRFRQIQLETFVFEHDNIFL